jgi:Putative zincin peptidase
MILIPGFIISLLTFPGVIVHEWAHKIACNLFGVAVSKVVYFKLDFKLVGGEAGYVQHEIPKRYIESLCISSAPLFVNTLVALACGLVAHQVHATPFPYYLFVWLGFSAGSHAFPSNQDMNNIRYHAKGENLLLRAFSQTLYVIMVVLNALRFFWIDFFYAYALMYWVGAV